MTKRRLASALLAEGRALRDRYDRVFGKYIRELKPGDPADKIGATVRTQALFAVYDGSTQNLGLFKAADVSVIVQAVTLAKGHVESINRVVETDAMLVPLICQLVSSGQNIAAAELEQRYQQLRIDFATLLKEESTEMVKAVDEALIVLAKYVTPHWLAWFTSLLDRVTRKHHGH